MMPFSQNFFALYIRQPEVVQAIVRMRFSLWRSAKVSLLFTFF